MNPIKLLVPVVAIAAGCSGAVDGAGPTDEAAIQGGRADARDPAVGLVWFEGGGFCSGTLIAPQVVLTAAHCTALPIAAFYTGEGKATTAVGPDPTSGLTAHAVRDQAMNPSYQQVWCPDPGFDLGLILLDAPLKTVKPRKLAGAAPAAGASCRTVGYGMHDANGQTLVEQKRSATETVEEIDATAVKVTRQSGIVDHGDSGGPLLCNDKIAAVTSCGTDGSGPTHTEAYHARVDNARDWIAQTMAGWGAAAE